jgi:5-hydroxyisourate hydrolase
MMTAKPVQLSTHVLDVSVGRPAAGVRLSLWRFEGGEWHPLRERTTNADGRTDAPLLAQSEMLPGVYELRFQIGAYFAGRGLNAGSPPFLDEVPIRFGIAGGSESMHVPLLVTPWSYSTYRGS